MILAASTKNSFQEIFRNLLTNFKEYGNIKMFQGKEKEERKTCGTPNIERLRTTERKRGKNMTKNQIREVVKAEFLTKIAEMLTNEGEEVLKTKKNVFAIPFAKDEEEGFVTITVSVPTGSRDGDEYDGYGEAESYRMKVEEDARKAEEAKKKKEEKMRKDAEARERKKAEKEAKKKEEEKKEGGD